MGQKRLAAMIGFLVLLVALPLTLSALGEPGQVIVEVTGPETGPTHTATPTVTGTPPTATRTGTATQTPTVTYTPRPTNTPGPTPTRVPGTIRRLYLPVIASEYGRFLGHWVGTTSRGYPMSFDVQEGSLLWNAFILKTQFASVNCDLGNVLFEITINSPSPITGDQFTYTSAGYTFSGHFTGGWTASGTYAFDNYRVMMKPPPDTCYDYITESGTWNAAWQPPVP